MNSAYEILGDEDKRKQFDRGEIDAEGKPGFQGFCGQPGGGPWGQSAGNSHFESFNFGPDGFQRRSSGGAGAGAGGFEDLLRGVFGGAMGGGRGAHFEGEDFGAPPAQDLHATLTITLPEAATGSKTRVSLPTGKEIEDKIPAGITDGQQIRLKRQGWPSAHGRAGDALITVNARAASLVPTGRR